MLDGIVNSLKIPVSIHRQPLISRLWYLLEASTRTTGMDLSEFLLSSAFPLIWFSSLRFHCPWLSAGLSSPRAELEKALPDREVLSGERDTSAPAELRARRAVVNGKPRQAPRQGFESPFFVLFIMYSGSRKHLLSKNKAKTPKGTELRSVGVIQIHLELGLSSLKIKEEFHTRSIA